MRNKIQVFGLQRSGTNFVEWTLNYNFSNLNYQTISVLCDIPSDMWFGQVSALKHNFPNLDYSDYAIVIYKDFKSWIHSMKRANFHSKLYDVSTTIQTYEIYMERAKSLPEDKTILIEHSEATKNYYEFLKLIAQKFDVQMNEVLIPPMNRMATDGGMSMIDLPYKII